MAELADALDLGSSALGMRVRFPPLAILIHLFSLYHFYHLLLLLNICI